MRLLLAITSEEKHQLGHRARHEFDHTGGTIGRNASCNWVLPDPTNILSARHASISYNGRGFEITDTSTNGVYVNAVNASLGRGNAAFLSHGDTLYLGGFELSVTLLEDDAEERRRLGVGQMAVTMRTDQSGLASGPPAERFPPAGAAMHSRSASPAPQGPSSAPTSRLSGAFPPLPSNDYRIRSETAPADAGFGRAAPMPVPTSPLKPAADAAAIPLGAVPRESPPTSAATPRQVIPHDIFMDILGVPDPKSGSVAAGLGGAVSPAPLQSGAGANSSASGSLTGPAALVRQSMGAPKTSIIPDTIDFGDLLSAPLSKRDLAGNREAGSPQAPQDFGDDTRSLTPSPTPAAPPAAMSQPPIREPAAAAAPPPLDVAPAPAGPTQRRPAPPTDAPSVRGSDRTALAPSLSEALRADMVSLRPPGAGRDPAGQHALDPVAVLRQRAAAGPGVPLPKPDDHSAAPFTIPTPGSTEICPPPRSRQTAWPTASTPDGQATPPTAGLDPARQDNLADVFWNGLGLDPARVPPQLQADILAECGRALREAVAGLVPVLTARRSLKDELRMDQTRLKPKENNPLKFLPSGEAVLQALIDRKLTGFLPLSQAIREGFGDIKAHEVAALVALDAVIKNLLARFDPASMEAPGSGGRLFGRGPDKARLWDNFVRVHTTLSGNLEETTRRLVGEEFARAYAQQVDSARHGGD